MLNRKFAQTLGLLLAFIVFHPTFSVAQNETPPEGSLSPSSVLLLNRGHSNTSAIDSGRYTVRPKTETKPTPVKKTGKENSKESEENRDPVTVVVPGGPTRSDESESPVMHPPQQIVVRCEETPTATPCVNAPARDSARETAREAVRQVNVLALSFSPGYLYNNSESSYAYRNYNSSTPTLLVDAHVWLNPTFSLHGTYMSTLSGHVNDSSNGSRNVSATQEWFMAGFRSRKFFGPEVFAPVLTFGLDYFDYQFRVPSDATLRGGLHTSGIQIALDAEIPANRTRMWMLGVVLAPKLKHTESATTVDLRSGGSVDANAVGISIGNRFLLERNDSIFWKISHTVEKDLFSGPAGVADPVTGTTPTGVSVINSFTMLQVGYTWGN